MSIIRRILSSLVLLGFCSMAPEARAGDPPDLLAHWVQGPGLWHHGQSDHISIRVLSVGGAVKKPGYDYAVYLSKNKIITSGDLLLAHGSLGALGVHAISVTLSKSVPAGDWYYGLIVSGVEGEVNLTNNVVASEKSMEVAPLPPDVSVLSMSGSPLVNLGGWAHVQFDLTNKGGPLQGPCTYMVKMSDDPHIEFLDPTVHQGTLLESDLHPTALWVPVPSHVDPGHHYWGIHIFGVTGEQHTADNKMLGGPVLVEPTPDLEAVSISGPTFHKIGLGKAVAVDIDSPGGIPAEPGTYRISLREAGMPSPATFDVAQFETSGAVDTTHIVTVNETVPPGNYFWVLRIIELPAEQITTNNEVVGNAVEITQAVDLVAVSIKGPAKAKAGDLITLTYEVESEGAPPSQPPQVAFLLSKDSHLSGKDPLLGTATVGIFGQHQVSVVVPADVPQGVYHLGLSVAPDYKEDDVNDNKVLGGMLQVIAHADLAAIAISGPSSVEPGTSATVDLEIQNLGLPMEGSFKYEIRLSENTLISKNDPLLASFTSSTFGVMQHTIKVPEEFIEGSYYWGLRIPEIPDEPTDLNNYKAGNNVMVEKPADLELSKDQAITLWQEVGGAAPANVDLLVLNEGGEESQLSWTTTFHPPVAWLTLTPGQGTIQGAGPDQQVTISFQTSGLEVGTHITIIRFTNVNDPFDRSLLPIVVEVGPTGFVAGDTLVGLLQGPTDRDEARFFGLQGMKLELKFSTSVAKQKLAISIARDNGVFEETFDVKPKHGKIKKSVKLPASGWYTLSVEAKNGVAGGYSIQTDRKLPKSAGVRKMTVKVQSSGQLATLTLRALPGATLDVVLKPQQGASIPPAAGWSWNELPFPFHPDLVLQPNGNYAASGLSLGEGGDYQLWMTGFQETGVKWKLVATPHQPPEGDSTIVLP